MKKLNFDNLENVAGGYLGIENFNFGEEETKQEIADFMAYTKYNKQQTLKHFETLANHFADACEYNPTEENFKKARYFSHLYNSMARDN